MMGLLNSILLIILFSLLINGFKFFDGYTLPDCKTIEEYNEFITNLPTMVTKGKSRHFMVYRTSLRYSVCMPMQTSPSRSTLPRESLIR